MHHDDKALCCKENQLATLCRMESARNFDAQAKHCVYHGPATVHLSRSTMFPESCVQPLPSHLRTECLSVNRTWCLRACRSAPAPQPPSEGSAGVGGQLIQSLPIDPTITAGSHSLAHSSSPCDTDNCLPLGDLHHPAVTKYSAPPQYSSIVEFTAGDFNHRIKQSSTKSMADISTRRQRAPRSCMHVSMCASKHARLQASILQAVEMATAAACDLLR